ncbi:sugar O-acyltransferase, sialic acid O-acetyltransferase NeuD family [Flexibacter flexilis DSM 6793]|uniref:Sugar O-acyltransferase, sialic acid O-acetyltransferase NeuD family n=1 Tax=Flexibacter flexilis DSM 6793 TaxID=927664 RepID=A0A1I1FH81_9BACT|nr:NeuD/PglB/VioB family sugar acetyltransferase [Flexibacter flexilis]SFB98641.1 sugar O-acyltransferase, sialic acid O-acetyltransferase NeuD family [Flexibacter flexilis DSM 6793]
MENPVIIFGAKGLGAVALDIFESNDVVVYGFLEDDEKLHNQEIGSVAVMGNTDDERYLKLIGKKCEAFVATDETQLRKSLVEMLHERRHIQPVNAVHPATFVSPMAQMGHGNLLAAGAVLNTNARLGSHCVVHAKALIDYDAKVGDFVQIGAGSIVGSGATVEDGVFIGAGVVIVAGVTVGKNARVGAGSVVVESVAAGSTVFGYPAKKV